MIKFLILYDLKNFDFKLFNLRINFKKSYIVL